MTTAETPQLLHPASAVRVKAIPSEIADRVRRTMRDDFGNELHVRTVDSTSPCRHCLRIADAGSRMILFAYRPFPADFGPYAETGAIFIHADACEQYTATGELPADYSPRELVVRAYDERNEIAGSVIVPAASALQQARTFYEMRDVAFVHARHPAYGCFAFLIERADARPS